MEKPILFSTEMVRSILNGRKTQTRRICKELEGHEFEWGLDRAPYIGKYKYFGKIAPRKWGYITLENKWLYDLQTAVDECVTHLLKQPYLLGDILWVRETWATLNHNYKPDKNGKIFVYKADHITGNDGPDIIKWRPSIHMPREAARLFLRVTDVQVERVQDITEEDARAEGCITFHDKISDGKFDDVYEFDLTARDAFAELWDSLYAAKGYGWDVNPWIWVIEFEVMK